MPAKEAPRRGIDAERDKFMSDMLKKASEMAGLRNKDLISMR